MNPAPFPGGGRIGVGIVGVGMWGRRVAHAVARTGNLRLVSCFARDRTRREEVANEVGCRPAQSLDELVNDPGIAGVLVLTPNHAHRDIVAAAARAGKHVLVEKPIADTIESARAMADACREAGRTLFVAHCFRRLGAARAAGDLVRSGRLGRVVLAEASLALPGAFKPDSWRSDRATLLGGPLIQLGVHHADTLQSWFGPAERVSCSLTHLAAPVDVDDVAVAVLDHASGTRSVISCSYVSPKTYSFRLFGTGANLLYRTEMSLWPHAERMDAETTLTLERMDGGKERLPFDARDMIVDELEEFGRCIASGVPPETGAAEGIAALQVILAAVTSAAQGRTVPIPVPSQC